MKFIVFLGLILASFVAASAYAASVPQPVVDAAKAGNALFQDGKSAEAAAAMKAISDRPDFVTYPPSFQAVVLLIQARAESRAKNFDAAEASFKRVIAVGQTDLIDDARAGLIIVYYVQERSPDEAAKQLAAIGTEDGVNLLRIGTVWWIVNETDTDALRSLRTQALENLFRRNFGSDEAPGMPDYLWVELSAARSAANDSVGAAAVRDKIVNPEALLKVETLNTTKALWSADPKAKLAAKAIAYAAMLKSYAAANPKSAKAVSSLMGAQLSAGQHDDAIATGKAAMIRGKSTHDGYSDWDEAGAWIANQLAQAYLGKKDGDNAIVAMKAGALTSESGSPNVSQTINLMILYNMLGRPKDALAVPEPKDGMSDYGRAEFASTRVCSHAFLKDAAASAAAYATLKAMQDKNPTAVIVAALCRDAVPEATAIVLTVLKNAASAEQVLNASHSNTLRWTGDLGAEIIARKKKALAAPEVQAALAKVGRSIETGLWSDFDQF